jgi:hypothetical protein
MRAKKVDGNQKRIVDQLRKLNISVQHLHTIGQGCPDLLLGFRNRNFLIELKDESKPPSAKKLTDDEQEFFNEWNGQVSKCETLDEILKVVGL